MKKSKFTMGKLDHVHIRVPNRGDAAKWYAEHLGFEPVARFDFWAKHVDGGPLQISADGGLTSLALFEASEGHPMVAPHTGIAFSVEAEPFKEFARSLPGAILSPSGKRLQRNDLVDFDLCWAYNFADPWGNVFELNCCDYQRLKIDLIEVDGIVPVRYWARELYQRHFQSQFPINTKGAQ